MNNSRFTKFTHIADLAICCVWLLLVAHECWMIKPFILLYPTLRIWISFLMKRQSKQMIVPIVMMALLTSWMLFNRGPRFYMFVGPWDTLLTSVYALFGIASDGSVGLQDVLGDACKNAISIISYGWMIIYPLAMYIYMRVKKQLVPGSMGIWKSIGLCAYLFGTMLISAIVCNLSHITIGLTVLAFMILLIPTIFYRNNIKDMFTRSEVACLLAIVMFVIGYVCGFGMELKSAITVCSLPAAFFALMNWYARREIAYKDILLIVGASVVFWCAQYTTDMVRILLLLASLAIMAVPVIRFAIDTKKNWTSVGLYVIIALIMPVFSLGYNPYSVFEAGRTRSFKTDLGSTRGLLYVQSADNVGLRDRYGVILPVKYELVELLTPSKPYCKVMKDGKWQIYDIERHELVSEEWFEDIIPCDEYVYRLKSQNGDKYLLLHWSYSRYDGQRTVIVDEMPEKNEE